MKVVTEMDNPFLATGHELVALGTCDVVENVGMLKQNTTLITQLFISLQSRPEADIVDFFKYENQR